MKGQIIWNGTSHMTEGKGNAASGNFDVMKNLFQIHDPSEWIIEYSGTQWVVQWHIKITCNLFQFKNFKWHTRTHFSFRYAVYSKFIENSDECMKSFESVCMWKMSVCIDVWHRYTHWLICGDVMVAANAAIPKFHINRV